MRAGLPSGWTSADKTGNGDYGSTNDVGIAYGPQRQRLLLSMMTRSQVNDPNAQKHAAADRRAHHPGVALGIDVGVRSRETPDSSPSDLSYVRWAK
jgi:hypothetical protein